MANLASIMTEVKYAKSDRKHLDSGEYLKIARRAYNRAFRRVGRDECRKALLSCADEVWTLADGEDLPAPPTTYITIDWKIEPVNEHYPDQDFDDDFLFDPFED